jgi:RHS repeat-associated protein
VDGKLTQVTAPDGGTLSLGYDGPLSTSETWAGTVAGSVSRTFDDNLRLATESVNGANSVSYVYDDDGLVTGVGSETITRSATTGQITATTLGSVTTTRTYNAFGEPAEDVAKYLGSTIYDAVYDDGASNPRDKLGRIAHLTETIQGVTHAFDYTYDSRGRLTGVAKDGTAVSAYTYDANGNRLTKTAGGATTWYVYDDQDRLLCERSTSGTSCSASVTVSYTWTANGELATKSEGAAVTTYSYDELGNLRTVALPNGDTIDYLIDGANRRIGKKLNGTLVKQWLYRNSLKPAAELDGAGNLVARFVYATKGQIPDYVVKSGATYRVVSDHLGSPRLILNQATGTVAERLDFDEWGNVTADTSPGWQPFGFDGGLFDGATRLTRLGARDLDPKVGRWTAKDPRRLGGGSLSLFAFVDSDPVDMIDLTGRGALDVVVQDAPIEELTLAGASEAGGGGAGVLAAGGGLTAGGVLAGGAVALAIGGGIGVAIDHYIIDPLFWNSYYDQYTPKECTKRDIEQYRDAVRRIEQVIGRELTDDELDQLHEEISGQGLGYHGIVRAGIDKFGKGLPPDADLNLPLGSNGEVQGW